MKWLLLALAVLAANPAAAQRRSTRFSDDFRSYPNGSGGSPSWHVVKGNWQVRDGRYEQLSTDYDCASMLDLYMDASFELEATFEHLEGDPGVGLIFASRRFDETAFAQMARFDGGTTCLAGYFQGGEFTGVASTKSVLLAPGKRHTLILRVNRTAGSWSFLLDGAQVFDRPLPLRYAGGYVGLQSSAGKVRFFAVNVRTLGEAAPASNDWAERLTIAPDGALLSPDERTGTVRRLKGPAAESRRASLALLRKGILAAPSALAYLDRATLAVADRGANRIHLFSGDSLAWRASAGWKGSAPGMLDDPRGMTANSRRQLFVVERNNNRVQVFDDSLRSLGTFGSDRLKRPCDVAAEGDAIYVLNAGLSQVEVFRWDGSKARWIRAIPYGGGEARGLAVRRGTVYVSVVNEVRAYGPDGARRGTLSGRSIGTMLPQGLAIDSAGALYVADYVGGRIVVSDVSLADPSPAAAFAAADPSRAEIVWTTRPDVQGAVRWEPSTGSEAPRTARSRAPGRDQRITLAGLSPATTYRYAISPGLETWPSGGFGGNYSFTTPSGPGTTQYARVRMAALIFSNIIDERSPLPPGALRAPVPAEEIERVTAQIRDGVRFYWMQSGMRLFLDVDILVVGDPLSRSDVYGSEWWYPPKEDVLAKYLGLSGREVGAYASFLYLTCTQAFDTALGRAALAGKGGGFTNGVGTGKGYGISWWDVTKKDHNAGNNWLMVHEFNHQLDDIFMVSGYPEYWFNHISPTIGTAGRFGEHFDANAEILRMVPAAEWTDLRYTSIAAARDADGDGIPDADAALPLDELRLGSDSTLADTDGDGVSDRDELGSSNWITEGWGETYGGERIFPNVRSRDTDGDGLEDGADPYPSYPSAPFIRRGSAGSPPVFGTLADSLVRAEVAAWWDDSSFTLTFDVDRPVPVKVMIDAGADGWFLGRGNYLIQLAPRADSMLTSSVQIFNATDPASWPFMDRSLSDTIRLSTSLAILPTGGRRITLSIPKSDHLGLTLRTGDEVGILVGFLAPFGPGGTARYVDLFEPNRFFNARLSE